MVRLLSLFTVLAMLCAAAVSSRPYHHAHPGFLDPSAFPSRDGTTFRRRVTRLLRNARSPALASSATALEFAAAFDGVVDPTAFGADPTGTTDSSDAMDDAVAAMCKLGGGRKDSNGLQVRLALDLGPPLLRYFQVLRRLLRLTPPPPLSPPPPPPR